MLKQVVAAFLTCGMAVLASAAEPAAASSPAAAATARNTYRVEVIVFRYTAPPVSSEDFSAPAEGRGFTGDNRNPGAPPAMVRKLEAPELEMGAVAQHLRNSGTATVLAHTGWVQTATAWGRHAGLSLREFGIDVPGLEGTLFLERGDLLHFGAQLRLGTSPVYALSELRRVKFNERHFLDHPAFGVIVEVSQGR